MKKVVVVGNAGIDTNIYLYGHEIDFSVEGNFSQNIDYVGQAGGYTSKGYARLGLKTSFIGYIGEDFAGKQIEQEFTQHKIDVSGVLIDSTGTARSINFMYPDGRRKNFYDGKDHMNLNYPLEMAKQIFAGADLIHFHIPNWARSLLPIAKESGAIVATDIQDLIFVDDPYREDFIKHSDYIFFSAANSKNAKTIMDQLLQKNRKLKIIAGKGKQGCAFLSESEFLELPSIELENPVIDTNGAGDSLAVGFLYSNVLKGNSVQSSLLSGQIAARHCCTLKADSDGLIDRKTLEIYSKKLSFE